jgi:hypothetical protein
MDKSKVPDRQAEVTPAMIEAGAEIIYDSDWEFRGDAEKVAARVYAVMESLRP